MGLRSIIQAIVGGGQPDAPAAPSDVTFLVPGMT